MATITAKPSEAKQVTQISQNGMLFPQVWASFGPSAQEVEEVC
jgi:hypothetical protein